MAAGLAVVGVRGGGVGVVAGDEDSVDAELVACEVARVHQA